MQSSTVNSALSAVSQSVSGTYVQDVSIKMLDNAIDLNNTMAQGTIKMMENSVTPYLGGNIDISVSQHIHVTAITVVRFTKAGAVMKHFMTAPALFIPLCATSHS